MDLFSGTGVVGFNMLNRFKNCSANDLEYYSYIINCALLQCEYSEQIQKIINECNKLHPMEGLIYNNFSPTPTCERMFFTNENAKKTDAIRQYIEFKFKTLAITEKEYIFVLASLLVSVDKIANTSCVYGAYLKQFKPSASKELHVQPIHKRFEITETENNLVYNTLSESFADANGVYHDVVYMDPPYNHRQYSANYSPLNYIALYNEKVVLKGKTALIENYNKSNFCKKSEVKNTFEYLINGIKCHYLIISYNNEGLLSMDDFKQILLQKGLVKLYKIQYNKFKSNKSVDTKYVEEYLWFIDTTKKSEDIIEIDIEMIK
jgi:adenine-specific DNA-methyltransferase